MHRLLILIIMALCFLCGLTAPALATDYCPPVYVFSDSACSCIVQNYHDKDDDNDVRITLYTPDGMLLDPVAPVTIPAGDFHILSDIGFAFSGICGCKVQGEGGSSRTSLVVFHASGEAVVVPCKD